VDVTLTQATGTAERDAAVGMLNNVPTNRRITLGADKNYDTEDFITVCRNWNVTPHVACRQSSKLDRRTTRHAGYQASQRVRRRVEEIFGWIMTVGEGRKLRYKGIARNKLWIELTAAAYNLVRMARLALTEVTP
jgi:IS5 family transposase